MVGVTKRKSLSYGFRAPDDLAQSIDRGISAHGNVTEFVLSLIRTWAQLYDDIGGNPTSSELKIAMRRARVSYLRSRRKELEEDAKREEAAIEEELLAAQLEPEKRRFRNVEQMLDGIWSSLPSYSQRALRYRRLVEAAVLYGFDQEAVKRAADRREDAERARQTSLDVLPASPEVRS